MHTFFFDGKGVSLQFYTTTLLRSFLRDPPESNETVLRTAGQQQVTTVFNKIIHKIMIDFTFVYRNFSSQFLNTLDYQNVMDKHL